MALPPNISYTKVVGRFLRAVTDTTIDPDQYPDSVPYAGLTVLFVPSLSPSRVKNVTADPPVSITLDVISTTTDAEGDIVSPSGTKGVWLVASDDPDLDPTNWTYTVKIVGTDFPEIEFSFVATGGSTLDLATMVPVPIDPGAALLPWIAAVSSTDANADRAEAAAIASEQSAVLAEQAVDAIADIAADLGEASVRPGGTTGQVYSKLTDADYDGGWIDPPEGGDEIPAGVVVYKGAWTASPAVAYISPDLVEYSGQVYMLVGATGTETPGTGTNWRLITEQTAQYTSSYAGVLVESAGTFRLYNDSGRTQTILRVRASCGITPVGQNAIVDVNVNGTSIYTTQSNRPTIASGTYTGVSGAPDIQSWPDGAYITFDIDQVGTTAAGADLTVSVLTRG